MSRIIIGTVILAAMVSVIVFFANENRGERNQEKDATPKFSDYPAEAMFSGQPEEVDFSTHPPAREFQTRIQNAVAEGVNFAGHYVVAEWGCGTNCGVAAIVDAQTGAIVEYGIVHELGIKYKTDSKLFVINWPDTELTNGPLRDVFPNATTTYFVMEDGRLKHLKSIPLFDE